MVEVKSKELRENYICLKYCYCQSKNIVNELQEKGFKIIEFGYNYGVYGWNYTAYMIIDPRVTNILIIDGYRPIGYDSKELLKYLKALKYCLDDLSGINSLDDYIRYKLNITK